MNCDGCACVFQRPSPLSQVKHATTSAPRSFHHFLCFTSNLIACHSFIISFVSLSLFSLLPHNSNRVMSMWCLISALHSLIWLLHLQSYCLSFIHHFFRFSFFVFPSSSQLKSSDVNVVFDFSTSLIDLAPSSPISFPVNCPSFHFFLFSLLPHLSDLVP